MEALSAPFCINNNIESIPTLETSKMRLFNILQDENTNVERVEKVISSDPAMAAKIIKLGNSPFYRHSHQSLGMHQSLLTIGLDMVKCIVLSMAVMEKFGSNTLFAKSLWRHAYATALVALSLSSTKQEKEILFTGALLHDLGRMVLLFKAHDTYTSMFDSEGSWPDISLEQEIFQTDHTLVGEAVARKWHFPSDVVRIIRDHHNPTNRSSALIFLINYIVLQAEKDLPFDITQYEHVLSKFFGKTYKDLVNSIIQRYKTSTVIIENLF